MHSTLSKEILLRSYEKRSALRKVDKEPWPMPAFRQPGITAPMTMTANPNNNQACGEFTGAQNYVLETQKVTRVITFQIELDCDMIHSIQNLYHTFSGVGDLAMVDIINTVKCQRAIVGWFDKRCASKAIEMIAQLNYSFTPESVHFDCIRGHGFLSVLAALDDHYSTVYVLPLSAETTMHVIHKHLDECGSVEKVAYVANFPKMRVCKFYDIRSAIKLLQKNNEPEYPIVSSTNIVDLLNNYTWDKYLALALSFKHNSKTRSNKKSEVILKKKWNTLANWIPTIHTNYDAALSEKAMKAILEEETPNLLTTAALSSESSESNAIDLNKIFRGEDLRSTVMIQNIPNKYDRDQFKAFLDVSNKNTYDFLYLRMDFANKCNVGYAFVNFIKPAHIATFVNAREGKKWNKSNSEKRCTVKYATIQGKDNLVKKFRVSKVMQHEEPFRPIIFHSTGPCQGEQQDFPYRGEKTPQ